MWIVYALAALYWLFIMYRAVKGYDDDTRTRLVFASLICAMFFTAASVEAYDEQNEVEATE